MKRLLSSLLLGSMLLVGAGQAQADLLTSWSYDLTSVSLTNFNTDFVTVGTTSDGVDKMSFNSGNYGITISPKTPGTDSNGDLIFTEDNSSASSDHRETLLNQATNNASNFFETPATKLADLSFSYSVASDANPGVFMNITYTMPLYTFYSDNAQTAYVYYNNSEVSTKGATAITHDGYKYGITGVGLFVDGRALVSFPGGENDPNLYSGWAINSDTYYNNYSKYVVGGDNSGTFLGAKDVEGAYAITGVFSIANSKVDTPPAPTPEPATMLLMGAGLAGLGFVKRRRQA